MIRFKSTLQRPADVAKSSTWLFLVLPATASAKLPTRGMVAVEGTISGHAFLAMLEPDGQRSHWLKVEKKLWTAAGVEAGDEVTLEIAPAQQEPEPVAPPDLRKAFAATTAEVRAAWADITPRARRDWIQWIVSAKRPETRAKRISDTCSMLADGKRRVCCFDRSGFYSKGLAAPRAAE